MNYGEDEWDEVEFVQDERVMPLGSEEQRKAIEKASQNEKVHKVHRITDTGDGTETPADDGLLQGMVIEVSAGQCKVKLEDEVLDCHLRGSLKMAETGFSNIIAVGDQVRISQDGTAMGVVEEVLPRRSLLARQDSSGKGHAGGLRQIVAANIDRVLIVAAWREPNFWPELVDRYLITAQRNNLEAVICVNKTDLVEDQAEFEATIKPYQDLGVTILQTSAEEKVGLDALKDLLSDQTTVLAGMSGVGKSSLLTAVQEGLNLKALSVGQRGKNRNQGRHTTTMATLYELEDGGAVVDTPGIRSFGLVGLASGELASFYPEMAAVLAGCKYNNCTHLTEPDCAVQEAVQTGGVSQLRYENYQKIYETL
jgi:ribosome biogenesis GTPase